MSWHFCNFFFEVYYYYSHMSVIETREGILGKNFHIRKNYLNEFHNNSIFSWQYLEQIWLLNIIIQYVILQHKSTKQFIFKLVYLYYGLEKIFIQIEIGLWLTCLWWWWKGQHWNEVVTWKRVCIEIAGILVMVLFYICFSTIL
jgi:hypothetical protein